MATDKKHPKIRSEINSSSYEPITIELSPKSQQTTITPDSLDQWAQKIFDSLIPQNNTTEEPPSDNPGRFGLKTPSDVVTFLRSPAGETAIGEMSAQIEKEQFLHDQRQMEQRNHELLVQRIKVAVFLWFLEDQTNAADKIKELVFEQNTKAIHQAKAPAPLPQPTLDESVHPILADYDKEITAAQEKQSTLESERMTLLEQIKLLEKRAEMREFKYSTYTEHLSAFEQLMNQSNDPGIDEIERRMNTIDTQVDAYIQLLSDTLEKDDIELAELLKHQLNGLQLILAMLKDMQSVSVDKKYYANAEGKEVSSFKEAEYILNRGQKIVKDNGHYYLLKPDQDWDSVKENPQALKDTEKSYDREKPSLMTVKKVVQYNKDLEIADHMQQVEHTEKKIIQNTAEKLLLGNQITLLHASRANAQNFLNQSNNLSQAPGPSPTMTPSLSGTTSQASAVGVFKARLQTLIKNSEHLSSKEFRDFIINIPKNALELFPEALKTKLLKLSLSQAPIPQTTMKNLLENMTRIGADPAKPSITNISTPLKQQKESKAAATPTPPNPFKTNPY